MTENGIFNELEEYLVAMKTRKDALPYYHGLDGEKGVVNAILKKVRVMKEKYEKTLPIPENIKVDPVVGDVHFEDSSLNFHPTSPDYNTDPEKGTVWTGEDQELTAAVRNLGIAVDDIKKTIRARMDMGVPKNDQG